MTTTARATTTTTTTTTTMTTKTTYIFDIALLNVKGDDVAVDLVGG